MGRNTIIDVWIKGKAKERDEAVEFLTKRFGSLFCQRIKDNGKCKVKRATKK